MSIKKNIIYGLGFFAAATALYKLPSATYFRAFENAAHAMLAKSDGASPPKKLILVSQKVDSADEEWGLSILIPGANIVRAKQRNVGEIVQTIVDYVKQNGTLDEFAIDADAIPNKILFAAGDDGKYTQEGKFTTYAFLNALLEAQEKLRVEKPGIQLVKRLDFLVCNVFTDQTVESVNFYKRAAKELNAEIVGTTSRYEGGKYQAARFAVFRPDGEVVRDNLDLAFDPRGWEQMRETYSVSKRKDNLFEMVREAERVDRKNTNAGQPPVLRK